MPLLVQYLSHIEQGLLQRIQVRATARSSPPVLTHGVVCRRTATARVPTRTAAWLSEYGTWAACASLRARSTHRRSAYGLTWSLRTPRLDTCARTCMSCSRRWRQGSLRRRGRTRLQFLAATAKTTTTKLDYSHHDMHRVWSHAAYRSASARAASSIPVRMPAVAFYSSNCARPPRSFALVQHVWLPCSHEARADELCCGRVQAAYRCSWWHHRKAVRSRSLRREGAASPDGPVLVARTSAARLLEQPGRARSRSVTRARATVRLCGRRKSGLWTTRSL